MRMRIFTAETISDAMLQLRVSLNDDTILIASNTRENGQNPCLTVGVLEDKIENKNPPNNDLLINIEKVANALYNHRVPGQLSEQLLNTALTVGKRSLLTATSFPANTTEVTLAGSIDTLFHFSAMPDNPNRPIAIVGPPGAGKTTFVVKLATKAILEGRTLRLISTDTLRAGSTEQLSILVNILGIELVTATNADELKKIISNNTEDLCLVDTAGINHHDKNTMDEIKTLLNPVMAHIMLILPTGIGWEEASEIATSFHKIGARYIVASNFDIVKRLGSILAAAFTADLSLVAVVNSPNIAEVPLPLNALILAKLLLDCVSNAVSFAQIGKTHTAEKATTKAEPTPTYKSSTPSKKPLIVNNDGRMVGVLDLSDL